MSRRSGIRFVRRTVVRRGEPLFADKDMRSSRIYTAAICDGLLAQVMLENWAWDGAEQIAIRHRFVEREAEEFQECRNSTMRECRLPAFMFEKIPPPPTGRNP